MVNPHEQPQRSGMKSLIWLSAPCLCLLGLGLWHSTRKPQEFKLITEKVYLTPIKPHERHKSFDTKVTVVMAYEGIQPQWLTAPFKRNEPGQDWSVDSNLFYKKNGRYVKYNWPGGLKRTGFSPKSYDKSQDRYVAHMFLNLSAVPASLGELKYDFKIFLHLTDLTQTPKQKLIASARGSIIVRPH
jgi:hypothetical protein